MQRSTLGIARILADADGARRHSAVALGGAGALGPTEHDARDEAVRAVSTSARHSRVATVGRASTRRCRAVSSLRLIRALVLQQMAQVLVRAPRKRAVRAGERVASWKSTIAQASPAVTSQFASFARSLCATPARCRRRSTRSASTKYARERGGSFVERHARQIAAAHDRAVEPEQARHVRPRRRGAASAAASRAASRRASQRNARVRRARVALDEQRRRRHSRAASCRGRRA